MAARSRFMTSHFWVAACMAEALRTFGFEAIAWFLGSAELRQTISTQSENRGLDVSVLETPVRFGETAGQERIPLF